MKPDPSETTRSASSEAPALKARSAELEPATLNEETRTVEVVWTTGARVLRGGWDKYFEELSLDPAHVRMDRLTSGRAPLLDAHRGTETSSVIGIVESARLEKGRGVARVRFAKDDPAADAVWSKVKQGVIRSVSVGYRTHKYEKVEGGNAEVPVFRAIDWEPIEISAVPIGADAQAHFRAEESQVSKPTNESTTDNPERELEQERVATIRSLVGRNKMLGADFAEDLIARHVPLDQARSLIMNRLADISDGLPPLVTATHHSTENERGVRQLGLMAEALAARFGGPAPGDEARQYLRLRVVDMAKHILVTRGLGTGMLSNASIVQRAMHTTSDFPVLLGETGNRLLRQGFQSYQGGVRQICRESSMPDFRAKTKVQISEAPQLEKVNEAGEFTRGTMSEAKESYSLSTFGKVFSLSRQALVNDDLGAFADMTVRLGRSASEFVNGKLVDLLTSNPVLNDGVATFHASHGNLGTAGVISETTLTEALKMMRLQKGLDGKTAIDVTPKYLVVPAALEVVAKKWLRQINATKATDVNAFSGELQLVVDPRLDAKSAISWYLAADPASVEGIEYSYLDGEPGPVVETRMGFDVDGAEIKVRLDFGCGVVEFRGLFKNAGA